MRRLLAGALTLAVLLACGTSLAYREPASTLRVSNYGLESAAVFFEQRRLGTVPPGQTECIELRALPDGGTVQLWWKQIAKDAVAMPPAAFSQHPGWSMVITTQPRYEVFSLQPAEPCK